MRKSVLKGSNKSSSPCINQILALLSDMRRDHIVYLDSRDFNANSLNTVTTDESYLSVFAALVLGTAQLETHYPFYLGFNVWVGSFQVNV